MCKGEFTRKEIDRVYNYEEIKKILDVFVADHYIVNCKYWSGFFIKYVVMI
jgi:hypothetical protein